MTISSFFKNKKKKESKKLKAARARPSSFSDGQRQKSQSMASLPYQQDMNRNNNKLVPLTTTFSNSSGWWWKTKIKIKDSWEIYLRCVQLFVVPPICLVDPVHTHSHWALVLLLSGVVRQRNQMQHFEREFCLLHRNEYDLHKYFDIVRHHKFLVKNQQRTKTKKKKKEAGRLMADSLAIPCLSRYKFFQPRLYSNRSIPFFLCVSAGRSFK